MFSFQHVMRRREWNQKRGPERQFTPMTKQVDITKYIIEEWGAGLVVTAVIVAFIFWKLRAPISSNCN
jgi:hypothetical protein